MANYQILVTDVTCYGDLRCVAGWDVDRGRMIRPEPPTASAAEASKFWDGRFAGAGQIFSVGNIVRFEAADPPANFLFPHATEDRLVVEGTDIQNARSLNLREMIASVAGSRSATLSDAFDGGLIRPNSGKAYVQSGHRGRSLGAIEIRADEIAFHEVYDGKRKLRARLSIDQTTYNLSVTSDALRRRWRTGGLQALEEDRKKSDRIHVRVGLARPLSGGQCYAQINGAYFL